MGPVLFVMAILGCNEGDAACEQVRMVPASYQSETDCMRATSIELARATDVEFPSVVAQCRRAGEPAQAIPASEVLLPQGTAPPGLARPRYADAGTAQRRR
jgi:hypothetical protein